ncbi:propionate catabolism operon regulatory protein PrpR [Leeia oryzae]|uniref:propionate catabolism operon regulatory protein PrpR n=1 Tax=Leeia oryzae TaxID=356662 RepID=UPI000364F519|nr:propionate catabolism operon regulatory protein PrpR [Leeia oryzae]
MKAAKPTLAIVAYRGLARLMRTVLPEYSGLADWRLIDLPIQDARLEVESLWQDGVVDAVVAASANSRVLRKVVPLPVATIQVSGHDVLLAIQQAHQMALPRKARVVMLGRQPLVHGFLDLQDVLAVRLDIRTYQQDAEAREILAALAAENPETVIVGSSLIVDWAEQLGMQGAMIYSLPSLRRALDDALELVRIAHEEEIKRERLDNIVRTLNEGVVAVDMSERIETVNHAMADVLGVAEERAVGRILSSLCPALSLQEVLKSGVSQLDKVETVGQRRLVTQRQPIIEQGRQIGAVLTFQDASSIERADRKLRHQANKRQFSARYQLADIIGQSPAMLAVKELAMLYAPSDAAVLVLGESGTGKELFAQGMHQLSPRRHAPFVAVNCAAFPESLLESELFGYEEGAFTGSRKGGKAGLIEMAHTGTLFLDEIGDMPLALQTRLLRVLQEKEVLRLGGSEPTHVDVRVMAATHARLKQKVADQQFRADLYYRLNILSLNLPPLRERQGDVPRLARHLIQQALSRIGSGLSPDQFAADFLALAGEYAWPGNVRELENLIERATVFCHALGKTDSTVLARVLPEVLAQHPAQDESQQIRSALQQTGGDQQAAARLLGISRTTLWRRMKQLDAG